jgi:hypothetical protein
VDEVEARVKTLFRQFSSNNKTLLEYLSMMFFHFSQKFLSVFLQNLKIKKESWAGLLDRRAGRG